MKLIRIVPENCSGCRLCEVTCSFTHFRNFSPELARIRIVKDEEFGHHLIVMCTHCADAPCIDVCPVEAITRDEKSGAVVLDEVECTECGECTEACPIGAPFLTGEMDYPLKCDLCGGKEPECVQVCSREALVFEETSIDEPSRKDYMETISQKLTDTIGGKN